MSLKILNIAFDDVLTQSMKLDSQDSFNHLKSSFENLTGDDETKKGSLEVSFRSYLPKHLTKSNQLRDPDLGKGKRVVDLAINAALDGLVSASMPSVVLSDLLDVISLEHCKQLFHSSVQSNVPAWTDPKIFPSIKNQILRICNDLLRRSSRTQDTVFCGKILLFLAKFFPLNERSGLNVVSEFNVDNITSFDEISTEIPNRKEKIDSNGVTDDDNNMEVDTMANGDKNESKEKLEVDRELYENFWKLQDFFRLPTQCYEEEKWPLFTKYCESVFSTFMAFKVDENHEASMKTSQMATERGWKSLTLANSLETEEIGSRIHTRRENSINGCRNDTEFGRSSRFSPKYLTNGQLFRLQLSDGSFRRYILVQFLIVFQYLKADVKFKSDSETLNSEQKVWVRSAEQRARRFLLSSSSNATSSVSSSQFVKCCIDPLLERENAVWNKWKNRGCHEFCVSSTNAERLQDSVVVNKRKSTGESNTTNSSKKAKLANSSDDWNLKGSAKLNRKGEEGKFSLGDLIKEADEKGAFTMNNESLDKLWNLSNSNMKSCSSPDRNFLPTITSFFMEAMEQLIPSNQVEDQYKKVFDGAWGWRALRLLAKKSPHFFTYGNHPIARLPDYLDNMLRKMCKESPFAGTEIATALLSSSSNSTGGTSNGPSTPTGGGARDTGSNETETVGKSSVVKTLNEDEIEKLLDISNVSKEWKKLSVKFGIPTSQQEQIEKQHQSDKDRCKAIFNGWIELEKEGANKDELIYILQGLNLHSSDVDSIFNAVSVSDIDSTGSHVST